MDRFSMGDIIGKGSYAVVRIARDTQMGKYFNNFF
jgi:hypothetical protein